MAIVKNPALSIQASGNICGICYSSWRGLAIARCAWTGTVPNTPLQVEMQGRMTTVSQAWGGTLTSDERETYVRRARTVVWRDRFGSPYIPNGYQLFMKWNMRRLVMGLALMKVAPGAQEWVDVKRFAVDVSSAITYIRLRIKKWDGGNIEGYGSEYYKAGPYDSGGRHPIEGEWRFLIMRVPSSFRDDYDVEVGKWYWYRARQITKFGGVGNWFEEQVQFA